jgi:hypothetical protein
MELVIFIVALIAFALLSLRYGHDSRSTLYSRDELFRREGFLMDADALPEAPAAVSPRRRAEWQHWYRPAHS